MINLNKFQDFDYKNKHVLLRVDFNVPFDSSGEISDLTRIQESLPTIKHLLNQHAKVILISHLGRPKGKVNPKYSLKPVASALAELLHKEVPLINIDGSTRAFIDKMEPSSVILLENIRFHEGEEKNDPDFSRLLASFGEAYINDAFGTVHRAHASTAGVPALLENPCAGFLIQKEIEFLGNQLENPERPFTVVLGGAKVSDKIKLINELLTKADTILIGGAMAYTFKLALGLSTGNSLVEPEQVPLAQEILDKAKALNVHFLLPIDNLVCDHLDFDSKHLGQTKTITDNIPEGWEGVDIGPETINLYKKEIAKSKTILWNGPMGIAEIASSSLGTNAIAEAVAHSSAVSIVGGGDSIKALKASNFAEDISFISTGGGASLQFLEGTPLPGIQALINNNQEVINA